LTRTPPDTQTRYFVPSERLLVRVSRRYGYVLVAVAASTRELSCCGARTSVKFVARHPSTILHQASVVTRSVMTGATLGRRIRTARAAFGAGLAAFSGCTGGLRRRAPRRSSRSNGSASP